MACPGSRISCHMKMGNTLWMATEVHILKFNVIQLLFKCRHLVTHLFTDNFFIYEQQSNNHAMLFFTGKLTFTSGQLQNLPAFVFFFNVKRGFHENPFRDTRTLRLLQSFIECQTSVGGKVLVSQGRRTISNPTLAALHCCHSSGTTQLSLNPKIKKLILQFHVSVTGTGGVHLQSEGHVSTQSTPEAVLLSRHHHLFVSCFSERAGQVIYQHMFKQTRFTQTCVIVSLSTVGLHTGFSLKRLKMNVADMSAACIQSICVTCT